MIIEMKQIEFFLICLLTGDNTLFLVEKGCHIEL